MFLNFKINKIYIIYSFKVVLYLHIYTNIPWCISAYILNILFSGIIAFEKTINEDIKGTCRNTCPNVFATTLFWYTILLFASHMCQFCMLKNQQPKGLFLS